MDTFDKTKRSEVMAKVRSRGNASTELEVVRLLRLHGIKGWRRHLPLLGKPDFAFPKARLAIFVDGCFWHGCPRCYSAPQSSKAFWDAKLSKNQARDLAVNRQLRSKGWKVIRVWECRLKNPASFLRRLTKVSVKISPQSRNS